MSEHWALIRDVALLVDSDGRIVSASPSIESSYGHDPAAVVGRPILDLIHPDSCVIIEAYLARPDLADPAESSAIQVKGSDGGWTPSIVWMTSRQLPDGPQLGLGMGLRPADGAMANAHAREQAALERLRLIDEMKHRLLEAVSHELRTPLTIICGFAETFSRKGVTFTPERLAEVGRSIDRQAVRLQRIVGDLMDLDRVSRGALLVERQPTDLAAAVIAVAEQVPMGGRALNLDLEPVTVPVDRTKFDRIVESLLVNVRRHTPPETNAWVRLVAQDDGALLEVADDGPGLSEQLKGDVFSPFTQEAPLDPASPGLGLGLALARRFTELHGGRCWVEDRPGGGARFGLFFPAGDSVLDLDELNEKLATAQAHERVVGGSARPVELRAESLALVRSMLRTARRELGMRVAYLSVFTETEQVVVAVDGDGAPVGVEPGGRFALEDTYCVRMVRGEIGNLVVDARREPVLANLPSTQTGLVCYAGVPVHLPNGHVFGSLCCADDQARPELNPSQTAVLQAVAEMLGGQLGQHQLVTLQDRETARRVEDIISHPHSLRTVFQPIVDLSDGTVTGVESLTRFNDSQVRPPDVWFADAERVGLASRLEQLAILSALRGLRHLRAPCYLAINVSPGTIADGGLRPLLGRISLDRVVIEITEHAVVEDYERLRAYLGPFRNGGAKVAIDDVGSGFASLRHVLRLEPDIIKMDRSLVHEVTSDPAQRAVAVALAELGRNLNVKVVAEGVEDEATLTILRHAGVTHAQGWLFDRPGDLPLKVPSYPIAAP